MAPLPARDTLGFFPTPLHPMARLQAALGGPRLWIKRDDLTGFALGGNKVRKLDPTYSAKAAAALVDLCRRGAFRPDATVIFWHTGGTTWHRPAETAPTG